MARIIYGFSGEGSGHASRTREIAGYLRDRGHVLQLVSYDRGYRNLKDEFPVLEIAGLRLAGEDNKVSIAKTIRENLKRFPAGTKKYKELKRLFDRFAPDCVITDFEPLTARLARTRGLPLVTLDNQHRLRYVDFDCPPHLERGRRLTRNVIRAMIPKPDVSLVTALAPGASRNDRTFLFPPMVRQDVRRLTPSRGAHVLVYLTSGFESLLGLLAEFHRERFLIYGYDRCDDNGSVCFRPYSKEGFLVDLASSKAIIATAGFTLISEALYLRKPYLALPMKGQFEQEINAYQLAQLGYGKEAPQLSSESIGDFLYRLPDYEAKLRMLEFDDGQAIKSKLDELLADDCRILMSYRARRGE
jgi:uncharacterized protein (TIGR00661 family)